jgi:hypothetical protein
MIDFKVQYGTSYESIELTEDFSLSIQYNSGIWNFDNIPGSFSLPFEIIYSAVNNRLLKFPHSLKNSYQEKRKLNSELWVNGLLLHEGTLEVEETSKQNFKCTFKFGTGSFVTNFNDVLVSDCEFGGEQDWVWRDTYDNVNSDFTLPQYLNNSFLDNSIVPIIGNVDMFVNYYSAVDNAYKFKLRMDEYGGEYVLFSPIVPHPYLYKVLNYAFKHLGYTVKENFFESSTDLKKVIVANNNDAQQGSIYYNEEHDVTRIVYVLDTYNLKNHVPNILLSELILNLKNLFCIDFNLNNNELKIISLKSYINSTAYVDITDKCLEYEQKTFTNTKNGFSIEFAENTQFDLKEYYIRTLKVYDESRTFPAGELYDLLFAPIDYTASFWTYRYYQDNIHYLLSWFEIDYAYKSNYYSDYKTSEKFESNIYQWKQDIDHAEEGNSKFHKKKKKLEKLTLAIDSGRIMSYGFVPKAYMSAGTLSLFLWANKALFNQFWKPFTDWYFNIPYELEKKVLFSIADLKRLNFSIKYLINNQFYFIDSIKVVIRRNGTVEPALVRLLPC